MKTLMKVALAVSCLSILTVSSNIYAMNVNSENKDTKNFKEVKHMVDNTRQATKYEVRKNPRLQGTHNTTTRDKLRVLQQWHDGRNR